MFRTLIFLFLLMGLFSGCQSLRDGLEGNKKSKSAEEFLIEKKNPLVLPPDYSKLPEPSEEDEDMLDLAWGLTHTSRLGCQIIINEKLQNRKKNKIYINYNTPRDWDT